MPNSAADVTNLIAGRDAATIEVSAPGPTSAVMHDIARTRRHPLSIPADGASGLVDDIKGVWGRLTDGQLALVIGTILLVVCAWPLALTEVPPFQDLPNHLAAVTVIENPARYPEFVFNGFLKTNAALFAWLYVVGKATGVKMAARLFTLLVIAANAFVFPRFVLAMTGSRKRMLMSSLLVWPMVHNWFVSMGMLDFALAVPLSLELLIALDRQRRRATIANGILITALGFVTWYAHVFPLLVVHMLAVIEVVQRPTWKDRIETGRAMAIPLFPVAVLVSVSLLQHLSDHVGPMTGFVDYKKMLPPWELAYNMWAEWLWAFSNLELCTLVPCFALVVIGVLRRKEAPRFFSPLAVVALAALYCFLPYIVTNWFHVNSRIIAYLWLACLVRVPERLPKKLVATLSVAAAIYSVGMGIDYMRLERERREFTAGVQAVPEGARLLPLLFRHKSPGDNTRSILHAWGYYVTDKLTAAPLLFAHSHSFPVMYSSAPPARFNHLVLEGFAPTMAQESAVCKSMFDGNVVIDDCEAAYQATWREFWNAAMPLYDHLLVWDVTPDARALIPPSYQVVFEQGRLQIYARKDPGGESERALVP